MTPIDCRTCGNYSAVKNKCLSTVQCQAGTQYKPTWAVQCWMRHDDAPDAWKPADVPETRFGNTPAIPTGDAEDSSWGEWQEAGRQNAEVSGCLGAPTPENAPRNAAGSPLDRPVGPVAGA